MTTFATLFTGTRLTANPAETMTTLSLEELYALIASPTGPLAAMVDRLRSVRSIDARRYAQLKINLPYFIGTLFDPHIRQGQNFVSISWFVLDLDHLSDKDTEPERIKNRLLTDDRIALMFTSPSGDGLKLLFRLQESCYDVRKFTLFYKKFAEDFALQHGLQECLDTRTCDVTRVCFLSSDKEAYLNTAHQAIYMPDFANESYGLFELPAAAPASSQQKAGQPVVIHKDMPDAEVMENILKKLNPDRRTKPAKQIHVPAILEEIAASVTEKASGFDIQVKEIRDINYGKKFVFEMGRAFAEINVFYGKNGFSVVKTPKKGSHEKLSEVTYHLLCDLLL